MKTIRIMSIIGVIWFALSFFGVAVMQQQAYGFADRGAIDGLAGWGYLGVLYALAFAIVILVKTKTQTTLENTPHTTTEKLIELNGLREKGILSEDEFQAMKIDLLKK